MLEAKKFFPHCCILAFMIKTISYTIAKLTGENDVNRLHYCHLLGYENFLLKVKKRVGLSCYL